jgi:hypothetical protein
MPGLICIRDWSIVLAAAAVSTLIACTAQAPGPGRHLVALLIGGAFGRLLSPHVFQPETGD